MSEITWNEAKRAEQKPEGYFGFHRVSSGWVYRQWAPGAREVALAGDFNNWNWDSHPLMHLGNGNWVLFLPGRDALWEGCRMKLQIDGIRQDLEELFLPY